MPHNVCTAFFFRSSFGYNSRLHGVISKDASGVNSVFGQLINYNGMLLQFISPQKLFTWSAFLVSFLSNFLVDPMTQDIYLHPKNTRKYMTLGMHGMIFFLTLKIS